MIRSRIVPFAVQDVATCYLVNDVIIGATMLAVRFIFPKEKSCILCHGVLVIIRNGYKFIIVQ